MAQWMMDKAINAPLSIVAGATQLWDGAGQAMATMTEQTQQPQAQAPTAPTTPIDTNSGWVRTLQQRGMLK